MGVERQPFKLEEEPLSSIRKTDNDTTEGGRRSSKMQQPRDAQGLLMGGEPDFGEDSGNDDPANYYGDTPENRGESRMHNPQLVEGGGTFQDTNTYEEDTHNGGDDEEPFADPHGNRRNVVAVPVDTLSGGGDVVGAAAAADSYRDDGFE